MKTITPTKHYSSTLHQLCKLIPSHLTEELARKHGVDKKSRTFTPWSHVVSLLFAAGLALPPRPELIEAPGRGL